MTTAMFTGSYDRLPVQLPDFDSWQWIADHIASPLSHGGVFSDPIVGKAVQLIVWHKPGHPMYRYKIIRGGRLAASGTTDDHAAIVVQLARISQAYAAAMDAVMDN